MSRGRHAGASLHHSRDRDGAEVGTAIERGINVLYDGGAIINSSFGGGLFAVPVRERWENA